MPLPEDIQPPMRAEESLCLPLLRASSFQTPARPSTGGKSATTPIAPTPPVSSPSASPRRGMLMPAGFPPPLRKSHHADLSSCTSGTGLTAGASSASSNGLDPSVPLEFRYVPPPRRRCPVDELTQESISSYIGTLPSASASPTLSNCIDADPSVIQARRRMRERRRIQEARNPRTGNKLFLSSTTDSSAPKPLSATERVRRKKGK